MNVCRTARFAAVCQRKNARITLDILQGEPGPHRDTVLLNAALALFANGKAKKQLGKAWSWRRRALILKVRSQSFSSWQKESNKTKEEVK
ncbi:hypothetical protein GCM10020331_077540 [Ectobacillus funiculus]